MSLWKGRLAAASVFLVVLAPGAWAATADDVLSGVKKRFEGITSLTADFTQEAKSGSTPMGTLTGTVYLQRHGMMKWVYSNGDVVASDGHTTWIYQPDLNQVIESKGAVSGVAADFLTGMEDVKKAFNVSLGGERGLPSSAKDAFVLRLTPKVKENNIKRVTIEISKTDYLVKKSVVEDYFGTVTEVEFSGMRLNEPIDAGFFVFKPPKGARVVRP